jgi:hypothetical protein
MTGGCVTSSGTQPQAVSLPADCDQAAVAYPAIAPGEDLGVRSGRYAAALGEANTRIDDGNACNAQVRAIYSGKGK